MSIVRRLGAATITAAAVILLLSAAHAATTHGDVGTLTARCRLLITAFDHHVKVAPSSADKRVWQLRAQGADECFGADSELYTMRFGIADLTHALRLIGVEVPENGLD
jgi:hypothetical protein